MQGHPVKPPICAVHYCHTTFGVMDIIAIHIIRLILHGHMHMTHCNAKCGIGMPLYAHDACLGTCLLRALVSRHVYMLH